MMRVVWLVCVMQAVLVANVSADEVLVRLQTVVEGQTLNGKPITIKSSEVLATTGEPFRVEFTNGETTVSMKGEVSLIAEGKYSLKCEEVRAVERGGIQQERTTTRVNSSLRIDSPVVLGTTHGETRWLGKRGRVHNSSMYVARARVEVVILTANAIQ